MTDLVGTSDHVVPAVCVVSSGGVEGTGNDPPPQEPLDGDGVEKGDEKVEDEYDGTKEEVNGRPLSRMSEMWHVLGRKIPREEMVFGCQMCVIFSVVGASIYNLTIADDSRSELWTALLSSCLGYLMPNPQLKRH